MLSDELRRTLVVCALSVPIPGCFHGTDWANACDINPTGHACLSGGAGGADGAGGSGSGSEASTGGSGGGAPTSCLEENGGCPPSSLCDDEAGPIVCTEVASGVEALRLNLPCLAPVSETVCSVFDVATSSAAFDGEMGTTYAVTLRVRGVVEEKTYTDGAFDDPNWQVGGTPAADGYNVYKLVISSPAQTYFVNRGMSNQPRCIALDYEAEITADAGATISLSVDTGDTSAIMNLDAGGTPIKVPDVPPYPAAFDGQFVQIDIVSVSVSVSVQP